MKFFNKMRRDTKGATAIEYGLIAALIAIGCVTAMSNVGDRLNNTFSNVEDNLPSAR